MRTVAIYSGLLAVSLVGTYLTWFSEDTGGDETDEDTVAVYAAGDVDSLAWKTETLSVMLTKKSDAKGEYPWVEIEEQRAKHKPHKAKNKNKNKAKGEKAKGKKGKSKAKGKKAKLDEPDVEAHEDEEEEEVELETHTMSFMGNEQAAELLAAFAPLQAKRELKAQGSGAIPIDEFGFDGETAATIQVMKGSTALDLDVGGETYGSKDRYVRHNSKIYLVDKDAMRPLQFAKTRLVERKLHPLGERDIERIDVKSPLGAATFTQANRDDRAKAFWARGDTPTEEDVPGGSWLGKVLKLKVQKFDEPKNAPEKAFTVTLSGKGETWTVDVFQGANDRQYYAKSDYTRGMVLVTRSVASDAIADLESVIGSETSPE